MLRDQLVLLLLPLMLVGQDGRLSPAARQLLNEPRLGTARLTWVDGRSEVGRVVRVTHQFIAFEAMEHPPVCAEVKPSDVAAIEWLPAPRQPATMETALLFALLPAFIAVDAVVEKFKRAFPLRNPLRGTWDPDGPLLGAHDNGLNFKGNTVEYHWTVRKRGRWSVEQGRLHLTFEGEPESINPFRFECGQLRLENPTREFRDLRMSDPAREPIIGNWSGSNHGLRIEPDGSVLAEEMLVRTGSFENSASELKIHWTDASGPGGMEWLGQIKGRHLLIRIGSETAKYHFVPPVRLAL